MPTETDYLKSIAEEIVNNQTINTLTADRHLEKEAKRLEKAIIHSLTTIENFTQRDTFYFNTLSKLVNICDILYEFTNANNPDIHVILSVLANVKRVIPDEVRPNLKLPKAFIAILQPELSQAWTHHSRIMQEQEIAKKLIDIAGIPFRRFTEPKQILYWGDYTWLRSYQSKLDIIDWDNADCNSKTEALISLLIGRDFNDDRFYIYCKKYIEARIKVIEGKRNRLMELAQCEKLVLEDTQAGMPSFDQRANSVSARLLKWIKEEIDFVETHEREVPYAKINFQFYKYTLAFFFKLLHEQKVFGEISFKELSQQIESTCTAMGADVPARSIQKKAYPKKQVDFDRVESLLVAILEYLRRFK